MYNVFLADWDIGSFLNNTTTTIKSWGGALIILIGIVMMIYAVYMIAKGLMTHGKGQTNWAVAIITLIIGGALAVGGFAMVDSIASGGAKTINQLGDSNATK